MDQDNSRRVAESSIRESLRAISVGSYVFQCGVASRLGLHPTDLHAVHRLGLAPQGLTAGQLGEQLGLTSGSVTAAVDRLVDRGWAERRTDERDGRRRLIHLRRQASTELGRDYRTVDTRIRRALAELQPGEAPVIARFLAAIATPEAPTPGP